MKWITCVALVLATATARAELTIDVHRVSAEGIGVRIGDIKLRDTSYGLELTPELFQLPPGMHGIHVHENGSCAPAKQGGKSVPAGAAGEHFDPKGSKRHSTPWDDKGHLGDMPPLYVDGQGRANQQFVAPRLTVAQIMGKAIVIHVGGDNFADQPAPSGGGGERVACGVVNAHRESKGAE